MYLALRGGGEPEEHVSEIRGKLGKGEIGLHYGWSRKEGITGIDGE